MIFLAVAAPVAAVRPAIVLAGAMFGVVVTTSIVALGTTILQAATRCLARLAGPIAAAVPSAILRAAARMLARIAGPIAAAEHTSSTPCCTAGAAVLGAGSKILAAVAGPITTGGPAIGLTRADFGVVATSIAALIVAILLART